MVNNRDAVVQRDVLYEYRDLRFAADNGVHVDFWFGGK